MPFRFETVRTRIGWVVFAPLIIVIAAGGLAFWALVTNISRENTLAFQQEILQVQEEYIDTWFQERRADISQLALAVRRNLGSPNAMAAELERFRAEEPSFSSALFRRPDGITGVVPQDRTGIDVSDRDYFQEALRANVAVSDVIVGRGSGERLVAVAHPVRNDADQVVGVVFGGVTLDTVARMIERVRVSQDSESFLLTADGTMITRARYEPRLRAQGRLQGESSMTLRVYTDIYERAINQQDAGGTYQSYWGGTVIGSYRWVNQNRWILVYEQPWQSVIDQYEDNLRVAGLISVILAVAILVILRRVERTISGPIHRLSRAAQSYFSEERTETLSTADFRTAPVELQQLADAFQTMWTRMEIDLTRIEESSRRDRLTGLYNRAFFEEEGSRLIQLCARSQLPVSAIMLDIDHFKHVNDTYGHAAGDVALRVVAAEMQRTVRDSDILSRYGGEEFVVFVPNATVEQGKELAERIRRAVEESTVEYEGEVLAIRVSAGVASVSPAEEGDTPPAELLATIVSRADRGLYDAKRAGRNRVVVNSEHG